MQTQLSRPDLTTEPTVYSNEFCPFILRVLSTIRKENMRILLFYRFLQFPDVLFIYSLFSFGCFNSSSLQEDSSQQMLHFFFLHLRLR